MTPKQMFKKLLPYTNGDRLLGAKDQEGNDQVWMELTKKVPSELFNEARYDLGMIRNSDRMDGNYDAFSNPEGFFMRWYVIEPTLKKGKN